MKRVNRPGRVPRTAHPSVESLEGRRLLTTINELGGLTAQSGPLVITQGPDQNLWFTEFDVNHSQIGRITPSGTVTEFSTGITAGSQPLGIVKGPDGNLWFTEFNASQIGRITPSGTVTEFSTGITPFSSPTGIVVGPDGNLWFTEFDADQIGRITPSGTVTEFSTGITANSGAAGIVLGPDGNLWFTEFYASQIGRITTSGTVTEFSTGISPDSQPAVITVGPDGNLWFTEVTGNRIAMITTSGTVTEFSPGIMPGSEFAGIVTGPDGNLWTTEYADSRIARITPKGVITEFGGLTAASEPAGITVGPDGNLWFPEQANDKIGQLVISTAPIAPVPTMTTVPTPTGTVTVGQDVTLTATVSINDSSVVGTPTGSVTFTVDGQARPAVNLPTGSNQAVLTLSGLKAGVHTFSATYGGDPSFATSASVTNSLAVQKIVTTVQLTVAPEPSTPGAPITVTVDVTVPSGGGGQGSSSLTGSVTFTDGSRTLGSTTVNASGQATASFVLSTAGTHNIIATYAGNDTYAQSPSNVVSQLVDGGPQVVTLGRRKGKKHRFSLTLTFDSPVNQVHAQDNATYLIVPKGKHKHAIPVVTAAYSATTRTVVLTTKKMLNPGQKYTLTVLGTGPHALTDLEGVLLDGSQNGQPGSNYVAPFVLRKLLLR
jgi:streptogramin lyase